MKISYFADTDTLHIELRDVPVDDVRDLDEDTLLELDHEGRVCAITLEHATVRADLGALRLEGLPVD